MPRPAREVAYGHQPHCWRDPNSGTSTTPCAPVPTSLARAVAPLAVVSVSAVDGALGFPHRALSPAGPGLAGPGLAAALGRAVPPPHPTATSSKPTTSKYLTP